MHRLRLIMESPALVKVGTPLGIDRRLLATQYVASGLMSKHYLCYAQLLARIRNGHSPSEVQMQRHLARVSDSRKDQSKIDPPVPHDR